MCLDSRILMTFTLGAERRRLSKILGNDSLSTTLIVATILGALAVIKGHWLPTLVVLGGIAGLSLSGAV